MPIAMQEGETLVLKCRRHWIYLYPLFALFTLILVAPPALAVFLAERAGVEGAMRMVVLAGVAAWAVYWGIRLYLVWYRYQNDFWLVTNQRLIDHQRRHWFHQEIASADLIDVQDTSIERNGFLRTMLNYGDLLCQTAGQQLNFVLHGIPAPVQVLTTLDSARDQARRDAR